MGLVFVDRVQAGRLLAARLRHLRDEPVVVLGLPRGGVPVAAEVAAALQAPLDVIVVRKLGVPSRPELAMGAIGEDGVRIINLDVVRAAGVDDGAFAAVEEQERKELERRSRRFRGDHPRLPLVGRTAVIVDDGIATGATARAACRVARAQGASRVILAVPVAPSGWVDRMGDAADRYVCLATPAGFHSIGQFYSDFSPTSDGEVVACLERAMPGPAGDADDSPWVDEEVTLEVGKVRLGGHLTLPANPRGIVVFAHGSGSSRTSPRNRYVAATLHRAGLGTLLFDLLTAPEASDRTKVFDIPLLAGRLAEVTSLLQARPEAADLPLCYFGASTGAAAALWAATEHRAGIAAVVSRGGRPDLAGPRLHKVTAPTLLVVGGEDHAVLALNRQAQARLGCENRLVVIPGATHLFEEPGTLAAAAEAARDWFVDHVAVPSQGRAAGGSSRFSNQ